MSDLIDEIMDLFGTDIVDFEYKKKRYREKLIKVFEDNDKYER